MGRSTVECPNGSNLKQMSCTQISFSIYVQNMPIRITKHSDNYLSLAALVSIIIMSILLWV